MTPHRRLAGFVAFTFVFGSSFAAASERGTDGIGFYTALLGQASVTHPGENQAHPVKLHGEVLFKDVIQTQDKSRTRTLFQDDSMLTVGENSRVEIDEYIYNPEANVRRTIVKLMQGQVRALVSKVFKANGSRFEIHTPSAVAAARGTYFTVWIENGQSGIINIGETGRVDFTSGGTTVAVDPGYYSVAHGGQPPSIPMAHHLGLKENSRSESSAKGTETANSLSVGNHDQSPEIIRPIENAELIQASTPDGLTRGLTAVERTALREAPLIESPAEMLQALHLDARLIKALTSLIGRSTQSPGGSIGGTATVATGTSTTRGLTVGPVSVGTTTDSGGTVSVGSLSVGSVSVGSTVVAPVTSVVSTVVAPVSPVITPVTAPVTPLVNTILATPPAVINGALNLLTP